MKKVKIIFILICVCSCLIGLTGCSHHHSWMYSETIEPTCYYDGYQLYICDCGSEYKDNFVNAIGHDYKLKNTVASSCERQGYDVYECSHCKKTENRNYLNALGHDFETISFEEATCGKVGNKTEKCKVCFKEVETVIQKKPHTIELINDTEQTCTENGYTGDEYCSVCQKIVKYGEDIPSLGGHKDENKDYFCDVCSNVVGAINVYDYDTLRSMKDKPNEVYFLTADIDLKNKEWTPFDFGGTLLGNNHIISNLSINSDENNLGFLYSLKGTIKDLIIKDVLVKSDAWGNGEIGIICATLSGTIENVKIESGEVVSNDYHVGGLTGKQDGGLITNSENHANVISKSSNNYCGGFVGFLNNGEIKNCLNYGEVKAKCYVGGIAGYSKVQDLTKLTNYGKIVCDRGDYCGGIVGYVSRANDTSIYNLNNYGEISGVNHVGGIFGRINCYNTSSYYPNQWDSVAQIYGFNNYGKVTGEEMVGGVFGSIIMQPNGTGNCWWMEAQIHDIKNDADVEGSSYVGGIVGHSKMFSGNSYLKDCYNTGNISGKTYVGGIAGLSDATQITYCESSDSQIISNGYLTNGTLKYSYVGGICGQCANIDNCTNKSKIISSVAGIGVGGIVGRLTGKITKCTNSGEVFAPDAGCVGGVSGLVSFSLGTQNINYLENHGVITGGNSTGGIFGEVTDIQGYGNNYSLNINLCNNYGVVSGKDSVGGIVGSLTAECTHLFVTYSILFRGTQLGNNANISGEDYVGGIIGWLGTDNSDSYIEDCTISSDCKITGVGGNVGTFVGYSDVWLFSI